VVLGDQLKPEFMQSQIEVGSQICRDVHEARAEIARLRRTVSEVAEQTGCRIVAASTHPFSRWTEQLISEGARYDDLASEMKDAARRMLIFGMHVHLGFGRTPEAFELMIDVLNQLRYFLPHILALTTSSPFWHGRDTAEKLSQPVFQTSRAPAPAALLRLPRVRSLRRVWGASLAGAQADTAKARGQSAPATRRKSGGTRALTPTSARLRYASAICARTSRPIAVAGADPGPSSPS